MQGAPQAFAQTAKRRLQVGVSSVKEIYSIMSTELPCPRLVLTQEQGSVFSYGQARQWEETGQAGQPGLALSLSPNLCLLLLLLGLHKVLALKSLVT